MVEWGLPVERALQAATLNAAQLLRVSDETGTVEPGKAADLVLYAANPLDDVDACCRPRRCSGPGTWSRARSREPVHRVAKARPGRCR